MGRKTSQLQIRISPQQKVTLKRLAEEAGLNVSQYVLSVVLPTGQEELGRIVTELAAHGSRAGAYDDLRSFFEALEPDELAGAVNERELAGHRPIVRCYVAAAAEEAAQARGRAPPLWTRSVRTLDRPHFAWSARSLWPHLMRITPVAFKRRNVFVDAAGVEARRDGGSPRLPTLLESGTPLARLAGALARRDAEVEACRVGGAVICIVFAARPETRAVSALFEPSRLLQEAHAEVAEEMGLGQPWLPAAVRARLGSTGDDAALELPHLRVFTPPPEYLLAMKCAAVGVGGVDTRERDDIRFLMRYLDLTRTEDAMAVAGRYFTDRQLPSELEGLLASLLQSG